MQLGHSSLILTKINHAHTALSTVDFCFQLFEGTSLDCRQVAPAKEECQTASLRHSRAFPSAWVPCGVENDHGHKANEERPLVVRIRLETLDLSYNA